MEIFRKLMEYFSKLVEYLLEHLPIALYFLVESQRISARGGRQTIKQ
jgi:hypothetical protein